ncbi:hypothetical protein [Microcoleus sp. FACHB-68]|uniref:hypothetical protein n=1 Tax=Microcoleus sp. FACHB-68 TaxID=2692826 RepID=UPI0019988EA8|nr:hypothetical protein [Microcoleus sp. FACHB-68]MBD1939549.1 hypothetical protein [Microcoleus sp. FACHB-68]
MGIERMKLLTGTTVSLLLSAISMYPAVAGQSDVIAQQQPIAQNNMPASEMIRGTIKSIVGDVVTIQEPDGRVRPLTVRRPERGALGLVPGMDIIARMENGRVVDLARAPMMNEETVRTTSTTTTTTMPTVRETMTTTTPTTTPTMRPEPVVRPAPTMTTTPTVRPAPVEVETAPDNTYYEAPAQPVRGLW